MDNAQTLPQPRNKGHCRDLTRLAIARGTLPKKSICERCGKDGAKLDVHHLDYMQPLLVRWLCKPCHTIEDRTARKVYPEDFKEDTIDYCLRNSDQQHEERLALEKWYTKRKGHTISYREILLDLQHKAFLKIPHE